MIVQTLNLIPKSTIPVVVKCSQNDKSMRQFGFKIMNGKESWIIDCDSVEMQISNGARVTGTVENNVAIFDCDETVSGKAGEFYGKLMFQKGEQVLCSASFVLLVEVKP